MNTNSSRLLAALMLLAVAGGGTVLEAQDTQCRALRYRSNFRLNGAQRYLELGENASFEERKRSALNDAQRVLTEAAQQNEGDPFSLWYLWGRVQLLRGDLVAADSGLRKAAALTQDEGCLREMTRLRNNSWITLQRDGVTQIEARQYDSALVLLRKSNIIYRDDPSGYMNMAAVFQQQERWDSAAVALRLASRAGTSPERANLRYQALQSSARMFAQRANNLPAAESAYREMIALRPRDMQARTGLASLMSQMGRHDDAVRAYDEILANADSLESFDLFEVGTSLLRVALADTANRTRQAAELRSAARAFETGLTKNPTYRDALVNLTNTYLAAADTARMLTAAQRLVGVDSLNRQSLTLLARAHQMNRNQQAVVATLQRRDSLSVEVAVDQFQLRDSTAMLRGRAVNVRGSEAAGFNLVLEFLDRTGAVVTRERVEIPALSPTPNPGYMYDFNIQAAGRGIISYRYRVGS